jgi:hypothetical protein
METLYPRRRRVSWILTSRRYAIPRDGKIPPARNKGKRSGRQERGRKKRKQKPKLMPPSRIRRAKVD